VNTAVFTFDRLQPGELVGCRSERIERRALTIWNTIYGGNDGPQVPAGFAAVLVMRAYLAIVSPRPPGNIHRALTVRAHRPLPYDEPLLSAVTCTAKQLRNGRRYVQFTVTCRAQDGNLCVDGDIDMIWAA